MGISPSGKRRRLGKVELIKNLIRDYYDTLHTEIREAVTNDVVETLENLKTSNLQPIGLSGFLLTKRQNSFYCTYFLYNRNFADTKSLYPIKQFEIIRWFNQKSMFFTKVCLEQVDISIVVCVNVQYMPTRCLNPFCRDSYKFENNKGLDSVGGTQSKFMVLNLCIIAL